MLKYLQVNNLVLIKEAILEFSEGLNILTGETGAGKSILMGGVNLALGQSADRDMIAENAEYALVELCFEIESPIVRQKIEEMDFFVEEDNTVVISRRIMPQRSVFRINGETANKKQVKELAEYLLDIHGQHEHQSLLKKAKHAEVLDRFAGEQMERLLEDYSKEYHALLNVRKELAEQIVDDGARDREISLARFEQKEIEDAAIVLGEDEELEEKFSKMRNAGKIMESATLARRMLSEEDSSAADLIGRALRELGSVCHLDGELERLYTQLSEVEGLLSDFGHDISAYCDTMEFSQEDFVNTQERLNILNHLKDKYGNTLEKVIAYKEKKEQEIEHLSNLDAYKEQLLQEERKLLAQTLSYAEQISKLRREKGEELCKLLKEALLDLNFLHVELEFSIRSGEELLGAKGYDDIELLLSTNPGQPLRPMGAVASGGELSRIMLGIKTTLADKDDIDALIFDEIDTGISGQTAWSVAEKLGTLSGHKQIICITHLPQIAAMADSHFYIEKGLEEGMASTHIFKLQEQDSTKELARMLGGDKQSQAAIENAKELLRKAKEFKR